MQKPMINVVYRLSPGEGPEPKTIGGHGFEMIPNQPLPISDRARARHLVETVNGIQYATSEDQQRAECDSTWAAYCKKLANPAEKKTTKAGDK